MKMPTEKRREFLRGLAITGDAFEEEVLKAELPVIVVFWARWCGPCLAMASDLNKLGGEATYAGKIKIVSIDIDASEDLKRKYGVHPVPTSLFFKAGQLSTNKLTGAVSYGSFRDWLDKNMKWKPGKPKIVAPPPQPGPATDPG